MDKTIKFHFAVALVGMVVLVVLIMMFVNIRQTCSELKHTPFNQMDSATTEFFYTNCI